MKYRTASCGCRIAKSGESTCPLHTAASDLLTALEWIVKRVHVFPGAWEFDRYVSEDAPEAQEVYDLVVTALAKAKGLTPQTTYPVGYLPPLELEDRPLWRRNGDIVEY